MVSSNNFIRQAMNKRNSFERYNQGFLKFGPMEQAEDGKWVEAEPILNLLDECLLTIEGYEADSDYLYDDKARLETQVDSLKLTNFALTIGLAVSLCFSTAFMLNGI